MTARDAGAEVMRRVEADAGTFEKAAACDPPLDRDATGAVTPRDARTGVITRCVVVVDDAAFGDGGLTAAAGSGTALGDTSGSGSGFSAMGVGWGAVGSGAEGESGALICGDELRAGEPGTAPMR